MKPEVSVVIATARRPGPLREAVSSALAQEVPVEVIVVDDAPLGSAAEEVVRGLGDPRVRYVARPVSAGHPCIPRNEGAALARGEFIHFLDDDDRLMPGALSALAGALGAAPCAGMAFGRVVPFGEDAAVLRQQSDYFERAAVRARRAMRAGRRRAAGRLLFDHTYLVNSACLARRSAALAVGGYDPGVFRCDDVEFYLRVIRRQGGVFVDRPVVEYRTGAPSLMHDEKDGSRIAASYAVIHRKYREEHGWPEFLFLKAWTRLAG